MKKLSELRDHVFRPLIYGIFLFVILFALFFSGKGLVAPDTKAAAFADISQDDWAYDAVRHLAATGCMSGYEKDGQQLFDPARAMTRAEVAQVLFCLNK